jgi:hypothetical protein
MGKAVGEDVGKSEEDNRLFVEARPGDAGDDGEGLDDPVDRAVDKVPQVVSAVDGP